MWRGYVADFLAAIFLCAVLYVLVRPGSRGADLVSGLGDMATAIVASATDMR